MPHQLKYSSPDELLATYGPSLTSEEEAILTGIPRALCLPFTLPQPQFDAVGDFGEAAQIAMRILTRAAAVQGAKRLLPVTQAHIDGCTYIGPSPNATRICTLIEP